MSSEENPREPPNQAFTVTQLHCYAVHYSNMQEVPDAKALAYRILREGQWVKLSAST